MLFATYSFGYVGQLKVTCGNYGVFGIGPFGSTGAEARYSADILCRHRDSGIAFGVASWYLPQITNLMPKGFMEHQSWDGCLCFVQMAPTTQSRRREHREGGFREELSPCQCRELKYILR